MDTFVKWFQLYLYPTAAWAQLASVIIAVAVFGIDLYLKKESKISKVASLLFGFKEEVENNLSILKILENLQRKERLYDDQKKFLRPISLEVFKSISTDDDAILELKKKSILSDIWLYATKLRQIKEGYGEGVDELKDFICVTEGMIRRL